MPSRIRLALTLCLFCGLAAPLAAYDRAEYRAAERKMDEAYRAGDYQTAAERARAMMDAAIAAFGPASTEALDAETALSNSLSMLGRRREAIDHARHVHATALAELGEYNRVTVKAAMALGVRLSEAGAPEEALPLVAGAVQFAEATMGPDDTTTITWRFNLAGVFMDLWYLDEALVEFRKCYAAFQTRDDIRSQRNAAVAIREIARLLDRKGDPTASVDAYAEALALYRKVYGPTHPNTADTMLEYGLAMWRSGQREALAPFLDETETVTLAVFGADNVRMADVWELKALVVSRDGPGTAGFQEGLALNRRAAALKEQLLSPTSSSLGDVYLDLAAMEKDAGNLQAAYDYTRKAAAAQRSNRVLLYQTAIAAHAAGLLNEDELADEVLRVAQVTQSSVAASATWKLGIRLALGNGETGADYRRATDLVERQAVLQHRLLTLTGQAPELRDRPAEEQLRRELDANETEIARLRERISQAQPELSDLVGGETMTLARLRQRLGPDDALVILDISAVEQDRHFAMAISRESSAVVELLWTTDSFTDAVADIRDSIGARLGTRAGAALKPREAADDRAFHFDAAAWLYAETAGQVAAVTAGKSHLYFDLRGPLAALPPQLLLTDWTDSPDPRDAKFLVRDHAVTVIPSVMALATGSLAAHRDRAVLPFLGYGDPAYDLPAVQVASAAAEGLRGALAPLPETADEVRAVAATFGAGSTERIGLAASEADIKIAGLANYRVLYFATHGLVAGDAVGETQLGEPALALTAGQGEDGFLTASEILSLRLNADWVVLSACNTAVGNRPGEQALSGLARAFIYAGARALLVSHWPVESKSAVALMTDLFARRAADPGLTAAEAQRQAILAMIDDPGHRDWAHPAYWAPFILVGDPG